MAGENDGFNGSTITFTPLAGGAAVFGGLRSLEFSEAAPKVNVTGSEDSETTYRTGVPDPQLVATWVGGLPATNATVGMQGALVVTWEDATLDPAITNAILVDRGTSGTMDGEITSTATFAPSVGIIQA
jgi:hypothetical protein